jgi:hypothetical protein
VGRELRLDDLERALTAGDPAQGLWQGLKGAGRGALSVRQARKYASLASHGDAALLAQAVERLKATGEIEYVGEFGAELTTFLPFVFWLQREGLMEGRRLVTYAGMRPYYYVLAEEQVREKRETRIATHIKDRDWPSNSTYHATRKPWHVLPDYRARYGGQGRRFQRPVLFIQNKLTVEYGWGPLNYVPISSLERLLEVTQPHFDVVYSRPGARPMGNGYTADLNDFCQYPDLAVVRRFDHVLELEAHCAETGADYNLTKLEMMAKSRLFVAVQGGGAHLAAFFGGSLLVLLHRFGLEYPHAYARGPYKFLASTPPLLLLARRQRHFDQAVELIGKIRPEGDELWIDRGALPTARQLRF